MYLSLFPQYLSDAADVEAWLREKHEFVTSADYDKDEDASDKLLTKHKARILFCFFSSKKSP